MHLIVYFCGTGDTGYTFSRDHATYADELKENNTYTLVVNGCHHPEVCNDGTMPNLEAFTNRFIKTVFKKNERGELVLSKPNSTELAQLGVGIQEPRNLWVFDYATNEAVQIPPHQELTPSQQYMRTADSRYKAKPDNSFEDMDEAIESITFAGYSRGAVTCFNAARAKEQQFPDVDVPVRIVADQPVPGTAYALPGTNAARIADCSDLKQVKRVDLTIAAYTGVNALNGIVGKLKQLIHNIFFSQIIPKLPKEQCKLNLMVMPRANHWEGQLNGSQHLHMNLTQQLVDEKLLNPYVAVQKRRVVMDYYRLNKPLFPKAAEVQGTFGATVAEMYDNIDPSYLTALEPKEYQEFLYKWWQAQETKASYFSTQLTKELDAAIKDTPGTSLLDIFRKADTWLLMKEGLGSSRYEQVIKLREKVRAVLIKTVDMDEQLNDIHKEAVHSTRYFQQRWQRESSAASWFKTNDTVQLGKAFTEHANAREPSKENDEKLLAAIDKWLVVKMPIKGDLKSKSSRFDLVQGIRERLVAEIQQYPQHKLTDELMVNLR
ncbi:hypothetical protein ACD661_07195 [Legionella lytica]|uniref:Dot/Icm T4SS effector n=1 Tax=Legionella lytica TaxID=96232 RepID=A0ABW8D820_9GAMM